MPTSLPHPLELQLKINTFGVLTSTKKWHDMLKIPFISSLNEYIVILVKLLTHLHHDCMYINIPLYNK